MLSGWLFLIKRSLECLKYNVLGFFAVNYYMNTHPDIRLYFQKEFNISSCFAGPELNLKSLWSSYLVVVAYYLLNGYNQIKKTKARFSTSGDILMKLENARDFRGNHWFCSCIVIKLLRIYKRVNHNHSKDLAFEVHWFGLKRFCDFRETRFWNILAYGSNFIDIM